MPRPDCVSMGFSGSVALSSDGHTLASGYTHQITSGATFFLMSRHLAALSRLISSAWVIRRSCRTAAPQREKPRKTADDCVQQWSIRTFRIPLFRSSARHHMHAAPQRGERWGYASSSDPSNTDAFTRDLYPSIGRGIASCSLCNLLPNLRLLFGTQMSYHGCDGRRNLSLKACVVFCRSKFPDDGDACE
jgi:hypothetical protein